MLITLIYHQYQKASSSILRSIKPAVSDFFSITARHFTHAGVAGHVHFNLLLNTFIIDVNNCTIEELNTVFALLLHKGHSKERTLDSSYRTISTCPLVAKGLDMYVRDLFLISGTSSKLVLNTRERVPVMSLPHY